LAGLPLERFEEVLRRAEEVSERLYIPRIEDVDGAALAAAAFHYTASRGGGVVAVDAGAGAGYSTVWLAAGVEAGCYGGSCRVVAVEADPRLASAARSVLGGAGFERVRVEVVVGDAVAYVEGLPGSSLDMLFVDIDKASYPRMLMLAAEKLKPGGLIAFHNYRVPRPPEEFYRLVERLGWPRLVIPSLPGLLVMVKPQGQR
jgi:predicted O-methyltransferase YrrM